MSRRRATASIAASPVLVGAVTLLVAIEAVRAMRARGDDVRLDIFGDGPDAGAMQARNVPNATVPTAPYFTVYLRPSPFGA